MIHWETGDIAVKDLTTGALNRLQLESSWSDSSAFSHASTPGRQSQVARPRPLRSALRIPPTPIGRFFAGPVLRGFDPRNGRIHVGGGFSFCRSRPSRDSRQSVVFAKTSKGLPLVHGLTRLLGTRTSSSIGKTARNRIALPCRSRRECRCHSVSHHRVTLETMTLL